MINVVEENNMVKVNIEGNCSYTEYCEEINKHNLDNILNNISSQDIAKEELMDKQELIVYTFGPDSYIIVKKGIFITIYSIRNLPNKVQKVIIDTIENESTLRIGYISKEHDIIESGTYPYVTGYDLLDKEFAKKLAIELIQKLSYLPIGDSIDLVSIINKIKSVTQNDCKDTYQRILK